MASSYQAPNWKSWILDHPANESYNNNPEAVLKICGSSEPKVNFKNLSESKNIALLTRAPIGEKLQFSFHHTVVGLPILPDDLHYVARLGDSGCGTEFDPKSLFRTTTAIHVPNLIDMMKVKSIEELKNLEPNTNATKKKIKTFAVLTPALTGALLNSDMSPQDMFVKTVDQVNSQIIPSTQDEPDMDELLKKEGKIYEQLLRTLWTAVTITGVTVCYAIILYYTIL